MQIAYRILLIITILALISTTIAKRAKAKEDDKQREMEELMEKLKENNMGGSFYSKDELEELRKGNFAGFQEKFKQKKKKPRSRSEKPSKEERKESASKPIRIENADEEMIEL